MPATVKFLNLLLEADSQPDAMFVQHERSEENFPLHQHQKSQFVYVEEGLAYLVTDTKTYFLPARHYVWIPPLLEHRIFFRTSQQFTHSLYFAVADDAAHPFFGQLGIYPVTTLLYELLRYSERWQGHVTPADYEQFLFLQNLKLVLPHISRHPLPIALPTSDDPRLLPVIAYIYHHLGELLELSDLAKRFGFSTRNLSRLFQQQLHLSFSQYLKLRRVTAAMELMLQTPKNISEIAYEVGYNSLSAFSHAFLQLVNRRPTEFLIKEHLRSPPTAGLRDS